MWRLRAANGRFLLVRHLPCSLGSEGGADLVVRHSSILPLHARLREDAGGRLVVEAQGEAIVGRAGEAARSVTLAAGDELLLGKVRFAVEEAAEGEESAAPAVAPPAPAPPAPAPAAASAPAPKLAPPPAPKAAAPPPAPRVTPAARPATSAAPPAAPPAAPLTPARATPRATPPATPPSPPRATPRPAASSSAGRSLVEKAALLQGQSKPSKSGLLNSDFSQLSGGTRLLLIAVALLGCGVLAWLISLGVKQFG
ncbi:MAG: hypothetical protein ACT4PU_00965 [Planctomycetota bacterium]